MSNTNVTELDFNTIKSNLKTFLKNQSTFTDYNFEGAGLNILLDVLAYNTHYNAIYLNMVANEMFLDSAEQRASVVSLAKALGYTPRSKSSSRILVDITIVPTDTPTTIDIPKYTKFLTKIDGISYTYSTTKDYTIVPVSGAYTISDVELIEGTKLSYTYDVDSANPVEYIIPNVDCDTTTIVVNVQTSLADTTLTTFKPVTAFVDLNSTSDIYFLDETKDKTYNITFGDGILGTPLVDGNIVLLDYIVSSGSLSNDATVFNSAEQIAGYSNITISTTNSSAGGSDIESISSIKYNAPKQYEQQNRLVTEQDYELIIKRDFPIVDSVRVWGGEKEVPPKYGTVFIAIKLVSGYEISESMKQIIKDEILNGYAVVSITPEIVDPDFIFININSNVTYDNNKTNDDKSTISTAITNNIDTYFNESLGDFAKDFEFSKLVALIDDSHNSISNNLTDITITKRIKPIVNSGLTYILEFENAVEVNSLISATYISSLGTTDMLMDDGLGNVISFTLSGDNKITTGAVGTIDYTLGLVTLTEFVPSTLLNSTFSVTATPTSDNITASTNQILELGSKNITLGI